MNERRRYKRIPIGLTLEVDKLYKQDYVELSGLDLEIEVINISKTGIGFIVKRELPLNYYFNACIHFDQNDFFNTVIKIVRSEQLEDEGYLYGCEFVGLASFLASKVDDYEKRYNQNHE